MEPLANKEVNWFDAGEDHCGTNGTNKEMGTRLSEIEIQWREKV